MSDSQSQALTAEIRMKLLRQMLEIRHTEEQIQGLFLENLVRGSTHLCIGQEACSVGIALAMQPGDVLTCTYRGHGHALSLGMKPRSLLAELMGKASGTSKGKGGSMHITDASIGLLGENAIVGGHLPIAAGAAWGFQYKRKQNIAIAIFGDGATNIGAFHESLNLAATWKLPVLFICENNLYGEYSPLRTTTPIDDLADRAASYGMPGIIVDGQGAETIHAQVKSAADRARVGGGPSFIELKTYRFKGHSRTDPAKYRPEGELEQWMERDPILLMKAKMIAAGQLDEIEFQELEQAIVQSVAEAVDWAKHEPYPPLGELLTDIYNEGVPANA